MEAHFGVNLSNAYSDRCQFIDGQVSTIDISEVVNNNLADDNAATIGGKGVGTGDGSFKFSTDVHGYLVCIYHAMPLLDYRISGVRKRNLKTMVTDYAIPEFDRTGMIKVPAIELFNSNSDLTEFVSSLNLGYAPQYYDYKTNYDEVLGAFVDGGLNAWTAPFDDEYIREYLLNLQSINADGLTYQFFKVNPAVLNPIFVSSADSTTATDQLLINCAFDTKAVRNLDYDGLPY